jgi:transcriptional regulator with XRE-family HTH domain
VGQDATDRNDTQHLTRQQLRAVDLLAVGARDGDVADELGVDRSTVWRWRTGSAAVKVELNRRREELWHVARDRLRALLPDALEILAQELEGPRRLRAAEAILRFGGLAARTPALDLSRTGPTSLEAAERENRTQRFLDELDPFSDLNAGIIR